jgi:uncharacterized protein (UPF0248 family)
MKKLLITSLFFIYLISCVYSQDNRGEKHLTKWQEVNDGELSLGNHHVGLNVNWKIWTLMGDPVYNVKAATSLNGNFSTSYNGKIYHIPQNIAKKIRAYDINLDLEFKDKSIYPSTYKVQWDAGAPANKSIIGVITKNEKTSYYSYNTPASTAWDKLFKHTSSSSKYISKETAKDFLKKGIKLTNKSNFSIKWDLSAVRAWLEKQLKLKQGKVKTKSNKDDFWSTSSISEDKSDKKKETKKSDDDFWSTSSIKSNKKENSADNIWSSSANTNKNSNYTKHYGKNDKYGFVDENENTVIPHIFDDLEDFSDGLAAAKKNGKWGFINNSGDWIIKPQYLDVENFKHGMAKVTTSKEEEYHSFEYRGSNTYIFYHRIVIHKNGNTVLTKKEYDIIGRSRGLTLTATNYDETSAERARKKREWELKKKAMIKRDRSKQERMRADAEARGYTLIK